MACLRKTYNRICGLYDLLDLPFEYGRYRHIRPRVFEAVADAPTLLDCGVGTGRNIAYYPSDAKVTGVDLCPGMLARARKRARSLGSSVELTEADVCGMPFADGTFDAAVATFLFCVLPDEVQPAALAEMARVVKPGGSIVLLEYIYSRDPRRRRIQRLLAPWVEWAYGARMDRRTHEHVAKAGLEVRANEFVHADVIVMLTLGVRE